MGCRLQLAYTLGVFLVQSWDVRISNLHFYLSCNPTNATAPLRRGYMGIMLVRGSTCSSHQQINRALAPPQPPHTLFMHKIMLGVQGSGCFFWLPITINAGFGYSFANKHVLQGPVSLNLWLIRFRVYGLCIVFTGSRLQVLGLGLGVTPYERCF